MIHVVSIVTMCLITNCLSTNGIWLKINIIVDTGNTLNLYKNTSIIFTKFKQKTYQVYIVHIYYWIVARNE